MSALTGLADANGQIHTAAATPVITRGGVGFDASGNVCVTASAPGGGFNGTCSVDQTPGATLGCLMHSTVNAIATYKGGIPLDANGALCTEVAVAASFIQGVGITAGGRVAIL